MLNKWLDTVFVCIGVLGLILARITNNPLYFVIAGLPMLIFYAFKYLIWIRIWIQIVWRSYLGKIVISLLHGLVFFLSIIQARIFVAEALGLPPQDFDLTVGFFTVLFYLPLWLCVIMILSMILYTFFAIAFVLMIPLHSLSNLSQMFEHFSFKIARFRQRVNNGYTEIGNRFFGAGATSIIVLCITWYVWDSFPTVTRTLAPAVRAVAYFADYQNASAYPGVERNKKFRLHENGVVSYAEKDSSGVIIKVAFVKLQEADQQSSK